MEILKMARSRQKMTKDLELLWLDGNEVKKDKIREDGVLEYPDPASRSVEKGQGND